MCGGGGGGEGVRGGGEEWGMADTHHYGQGALYHVNVFSDTLSVTVPCHVPELPQEEGQSLQVLQKHIARTRIHLQGWNGMPLDGTNSMLQ